MCKVNMQVCGEAVRWRLQRNIIPRLMKPKNMVRGLSVQLWACVAECVYAGCAWGVAMRLAKC